MLPHALHKHASILLAHPFALQQIAPSDAARRRCAELDDSVRKAAGALRRFGPDADSVALALAGTGRLDLTVPGSATPVRFPDKPPLEAALRDRPAIAGSAALSAAVAARALTPWHLRQANAAAIGFRVLPFRIGPHHLAADADGIAVFFPPTDCARVLTQLCAWLNGPPGLPATAQALIAYLQICKLHAFHDGNGRTARLLLTAVLNARLVHAPDLYLPLAAVTFANAELLSAEYRRAADARSLDDFLIYGTALIDRALDAAAAAQPMFQQST
jgi:hypothetical protein